MRKLLPAAAAAAALTFGLAPAAAKPRSHDREERSRSHVALHLSTHSLLKGKVVALRGKVRPSGRRRVKVVFRGPEGGVRELTTKANGVFRLHWGPRRPGSYAVRAYAVHSRRTRGSQSPARGLTTYRLAGASYYGPGLYGNGVACGGTLLPGTMGVAHKTLPCGTKVKLRYHGRTVTVPVIDRGPYVPGRDYDLTTAVKERLGFPGVGTVLASR